MLDRADCLPGEYDLVITTADEVKAEAIRAVLAGRPARGAREVRVVASNNGRDQRAFLIDCRDVLLSGEYDLLVKIHSKKTPQDIYNVGRHFREQQFTNLLNSPGYAANVVALFQREPGLGLAYPPTVHLGLPDARARLVGEQARVRRAVQGTRHPRAAGRHLAARAVRIHVLRPPRGAAGAPAPRVEPRRLRWCRGLPGRRAGAHPRADAVVRRRGAGLPHADDRQRRVPRPEPHRAGVQPRPAVGTIPGASIDQIGLLHILGKMGDGSIGDFLRMYMRRHHPQKDPEMLAPWGARVVRARGVLGRLRDPRRWIRRGSR